MSDPLSLPSVVLVTGTGTEVAARVADLVEWLELDVGRVESARRGRLGAATLST